MTDRQEIFRSLKKQILALEGFKEPLLSEGKNLGRMAEAFPNSVFTFAALHEFFYYRPEEAAASSAFISALLSSRTHKECGIVWISTSQKIFPPALKWFGILPHQVLFLHVRKEKDIPWAIQEAIKCSSLSAVVGELPEINLTTSRRFQLAIEETGVGCFLLRAKPKNLLTTAVSRWHIQPQHSLIEEGLPGIGHPRWRVNLLKVRNGKTGSWDIEWVNGGFRYGSSKLAVIHKAMQKQAG
ncbi:MAG: Error-prone repair protein ImuA [Chitinophagaceae bacterium]|nr:MAG: Error-prone repair protein ImuA [Chitinophagaceae bacterium]